jgi:hypothetical protein
VKSDNSKLQTPNFKLKATMIIDLDQLTAAAVEPVVIRTRGGEYRVRELSVAEVLSLDSIGEKTDSEVADFLRGFFVEPPPQFDEYMNTPVNAVMQRQHNVTQIALLLGAIKTAYAEMSQAGKQMAVLMPQIHQQITRQLATVQMSKEQMPPESAPLPELSVT